jgi:hypothetical protein
MFMLIGQLQAPTSLPPIASSMRPPAHAGSSLEDFSTLNMEAIRSSETSVHTRSTRRHIPEDGILPGHRRENLKSYKSNICLFSFLPDYFTTLYHSLGLVISQLRSYHFT